MTLKIPWYSVHQQRRTGLSLNICLKVYIRGELSTKIISNISSRVCKMLRGQMHTIMQTFAQSKWRKHFKTTLKNESSSRGNWRYSIKEIGLVKTWYLYERGSSPTKLQEKTVCKIPAWNETDQNNSYLKYHFGTGIKSPTLWRKQKAPILPSKSKLPVASVSLLLAPDRLFFDHGSKINYIENDFCRNLIIKRSTPDFRRLMSTKNLKKKLI